MRNLLLAISLILITVTSFGILSMSDNSPETKPPITHPLDNMPLVEHPGLPVLNSTAPIPQRDEAYRKWLCTGVKISVKSASGSGTIVYFNPQDGWAYIQSCGHLWSGNMTAKEGETRHIKCTITTWYHNDKKLDEPKTYPAEVLFYNNNEGPKCKDVSLLRFKPDWVPNYLPLGPESHELTKGDHLHSVGCDHATEVAHYDVEYMGLRGDTYPDIVTRNNSPRPGRSGGGLMDEYYFVGICWGTEKYSGEGAGFFTPLKTIREFNEKNGFQWLNEISSSLARRIPIVDRNNPQKDYAPTYIPLPNEY